MGRISNGLTRARLGSGDGVTQPPSELLDETELEDLFVDFINGDRLTTLGLPHVEAHQFMAYALQKLGQLWLQLEQRTAA